MYVNGRVPKGKIEQMKRAGYEVKGDDEDGMSCPLAILECLHGQAVSYVAHTRQMRDILLGAIVSNVNDGYVLDWQGDPLVWPESGRVPEVVFGVGRTPERLLECLRE